MKNGIFKTENGYGYRVVIDGKEKKRIRTLEGQIIKTKKQAEEERERLIKRKREEREKKEKEVYITRCTVDELWNEYIQAGRSDKAYTTKLKQDSVYKHHIKDKWGDVLCHAIIGAQVNDWLRAKYYDDEYSYSFVGSLVKVMYLILGQAYARKHITTDEYAALTKNSDTKIKAPQRKGRDEETVDVYDDDTICKLKEYFTGTNAEMAFLLGVSCGLRISEAYGIKIDHLNLEERTIYIDRQMQYQDGVIKLVEPKTNNAYRTVYINDDLYACIVKRLEIKIPADILQQNQTTIIDADGRRISSFALLNTTPDGKIQTVHSLKYHAKKIKQKLGIEFKYHTLRHTYGTRMARRNIPQHLLKKLMGHSKIETTASYYLGVTQQDAELMLKLTNQL